MMNVTRTVQVAIFRDDSLLVSMQGDFWRLPGGELEEGETTEDGAARILFRDTGVIGHKFFVYSSHCISTEKQKSHIISVQGEYLFCAEQDERWSWHPWTAVPSPKMVQLEDLLRLYWSDFTEEPEVEAELSFEADAKREHQRVALSAFVTAEGSMIQLASKSHNVSRGGLFLVTDADLTPGQELSLNITLPDQRQLQCLGRVKWRRPSYLATKQKPAGVGIEFVSPQKSVVETIKEVLARYQTLSFSEKFPTDTGEYGALQRAPRMSKR
jgi:ADP-ribose pyrophosphatase YjhB (NUDIX family)/Tfp pilus assembly protein PilZ